MTVVGIVVTMVFHVISGQPIQNIPYLVYIYGHFIPYFAHIVSVSLMFGILAIMKSILKFVIIYKDHFWLTVTFIVWESMAAIYYVYLGNIFWLLAIFVAIEVVLMVSFAVEVYKSQTNENVTESLSMS